MQINLRSTRTSPQAVLHRPAAVVVPHETLHALKSFLSSALHFLGHLASAGDTVTPTQRTSSAMRIDLATLLLMVESLLPWSGGGILDGTLVPSASAQPR